MKESCSQDRPALVAVVLLLRTGATLQRGSSSSEKKRRNKQSPQPHQHPTEVEIESEKRRSRETPPKRRSKETVSSHSPRQERRTPRHGESYRPSLNVQPESRNSSQEMLLNPRPHRSQHHRQRHPKHTSQSTLRGRGEKRDPPRKSKSKRSLQHQSPRSAWSFLIPSPPPKTPSRSNNRSHRNYETLHSSPRSNHQSRSHQRPAQQYQHQGTSQSSQTQRHHRSPRSMTPNTAARRTPDRRFAVLAATNQALEDLRREAFAQPSPPPRRERVQRYQGTNLPTSSIPFNWDCISSSQTSAGGESSTRYNRRSRR
ncbi:hypothetical protein BU24DRAFT_430699 [Aaosphaeria arxii CBS 175.79]|uniref:Uncharacterized protein n=1 Tax=Aaosphaeria arxii CBS 175.79 TaxID=1450172 RepID=A0A6A5Y9U3_9PLEO|nr:uncharacterized protein BU24DRAFT_430699 [Aaosphaeria arxii CBS 175.79]KAF2022355.1 hypothetical protein BU24DRAFT_430699 [Aaosphaeria arxii CBS 175.79]